jgi:hypothetical protein
MGVTGKRSDDPGMAALLGIGAILFSLLYFITDIIELFQGGFSTSQLVLTFAAEAAIPFLVLGLYSVQRPQIGRLGLVAAAAYAYAFVFFTGTVLYALVNHTSDWEMLQKDLGAWMTIHSALMVVAGVALGVAVARAKVLPRWTGTTLIAGMVLMASTAGLPELIRTLAAGVRDLAFAAMGASVLGGVPLPERPADTAPAQSSAPVRQRQGSHFYVRVDPRPL